jgi:hypothetical protein
LYAETDGSTDFTIQPGGATNVGVPISNVDDTKRTAFNLKAVYELARQWQLTAGYAYEKYRYSDIGYDNTRYVAGPAAAPFAPGALSNTSSAIVTGQFSFQDYEAHIAYLVAKYRF